MRKQRKHHDRTRFSETWGVHAHELAEQEGLQPDAIHMRVHKFGNPFQRRKNPTKVEKLTGRTLADWADELNLHPLTIIERMKKHGDPRYQSDDGGRGGRHQRRAEVAWQDSGKYRNKEWLMPQHPQYAEWKSKFTKWRRLSDEE